MGMLAKLERLIGEIGDLNSKLILLVGPSRSGKTQLILPRSPGHPVKRIQS